MSTHLDLEQLISTTNTFVAGQFGVKPVNFPIKFLNTLEVAKLRKDGQAPPHARNFASLDGTAYITLPTHPNLQKQKAEVYTALAAELAHLYHNRFGNGTPGIIFDYSWIPKIRLKRSQVYTLSLPGEMIEDHVLPKGRNEAVDIYCQIGIMHHLGLHNEALKIQAQEKAWKSFVRRVVKDATNLLKARDSQQLMISYEKLLLSEISESHVVKNPVSAQFFSLANALGYWLAQVHAGYLNQDAEKFQDFANRGTGSDITVAERNRFYDSLQDLNNSLRDLRLPELSSRQ